MRLWSRLVRFAIVLAAALPGTGLAQRFETFPVGGYPTFWGLTETPDGIYVALADSMAKLLLFRHDSTSFEQVNLGAPLGHWPHSVLYDICTASDGSLWVSAGNYLVRRGPGERQDSYPEQVPGSQHMPVACRGTGEVWSSQDSRVLRYSSDGRLLGEFSHMAIHSYIGLMWGCPDGSLWFQRGGSELARLAPDNQLSFFATPHRSGSQDFPEDVACTSNGFASYTLQLCQYAGTIYCTESKVVRILSQGTQRIIDLPEDRSAWAIVEGPDGATWFTTEGGLGRVDDSDAVTFYRDGVSRYSGDLIVGRDGNLWFGDSGARGLTRFILPPFLQTVPALVGTRGESGVLYTSDLSVANWGSTPASVTFRYVPSRPASGVEEAGVTEQLLPGRQLVLDDAFAWLRSRGIQIPDTGNVGTLLVESEGAFPWRGVTAIARTTSPSGPGRAGVAYPALRETDLPSTPGSRLRLFGLRQTSSDRTNLALVNASRTAPARLAVTVFSGDGSGARANVPDVFLGPGKWTQLDSVLASGAGAAFSQGWVEVESVGEERTPWVAYAVVNDAATNDGSYVSPAEPSPEVLLPALVETGTYRSELILSNPDCAPVTAELTFFPAGAPPRTSSLTLAVLEQRILPRANEVLGLGAGVGPLLVRFTDERGRPAEGVASVRVATPDGYGVFLPGVSRSDLKAGKVRVAGLRQGNGLRSSLVLVNAETEATLTLRVTVVDGETGTRKAPLTVTLPPLGFEQVDQVLAPHGLSQGWAEVERTATTVAGSGRFLAYGVLNDGERPGEGTGDGSILPMATEK